tara:strand:- start:298 stop:516 length:219 start_codon:yes stop_codon:yes gene_type:complete
MITKETGSMSRTEVHMRLGQLSKQAMMMLICSATDLSGGVALLISTKAGILNTYISPLEIRHLNLAMLDRSL